MALILTIIIVILIVVMLWITGGSSIEKYTSHTFQDTVGSQVQDIHGLYGTVSQKIKYPTYTDLVQYGVTSLPRWEMQ